MSVPAVSVVIVNYNAGAMLTACVRSALSSAVAVEVIVSDNGSHDDSLAQLEAALGDHPGVQVIRNEANLGFARGNNVALERCRSELVLLLNPDAALAPDALDALVSAAGAHPEFACFALRMIQSERHDTLDGAGDSYHASGVARRRGYGAPVSDPQYDEPAEVFSACAAAALYRRSALAAVGGFDEDFFCYLEDVDLGFRLRLAGLRTLYLPQATAWHVGSATTGRDSDFSVYHIQRNLVWTYVKNMPGALFWLYLPLHLAANLHGVARYAVRGRWRVILTAKWHAAQGLRAAWRKRRALQSRRVARTSQIRTAMAARLRDAKH